MFKTLLYDDSLHLMPGSGRKHAIPSVDQWRALHAVRVMPSCEHEYF